MSATLNKIIKTRGSNKLLCALLKLNPIGENFKNKD